MKLTSKKVLELNKKYNLIENLCEREINNPEGIELELRVEKVEKIMGESFLGVEERKSPKTEIIGDINKHGNKKITIKPGEFYLVTTMETINCPKEKIKYDENFEEGYLCPVIEPRTSLQRSGISLLCSTTNPGYKGKLVFGLKNNSDYDFNFELGARMFKIYFEAVIGEIQRDYSGQHQGGRATSQDITEIQN